MKRRDFLLLRKTPAAQVAELRGQVLYMRSLDAGLTHRVDEDGNQHVVEGSADWLAETVDDLKRQLAAASVLRVVDREWITGGALGAAVDAVIADFIGRGGQVRYCSPP